MEEKKLTVHGEMLIEGGLVWSLPVGWLGLEEEQVEEMMEFQVENVHFRITCTNDSIWESGI